MAHVDPTQAFLDEAGELLLELERDLLELERDPRSADLVARAFRSIHTIKGSGAMFGFEEIARFSHELETALDMVRDGRLGLTAELLTVTLLAKDHIHILLRAPDPAARAPGSDALLDELRRLTAPDAPTAPPAAPSPDAAGPSGAAAANAGPAGANPSAGHQVYWVRYRPKATCFLCGAEPLSLIEELARLGPTAEVFHGRDIPELSDIDPERVYCSWDILVDTDAGEQALRDVFVFCDEGEALIEHIGRGLVRGEDLEDLAVLFKGRSDDDPARLLAELRQRFEDLGRRIALAREKIRPPERAPGGGESQSIRVDAPRLDRLINLVGELVIIQSRLSQASHAGAYERVGQIAEDFERLMDETRDTALSLRMVPFGSACGGLRRLVRDVSTMLGKKVDFAIEGEDTELDKTLIDLLKDPLMHILRNALDHGLETPEERLAAGKDPVGRIRLAARHQGGEVVLTVSDDGRGIDTRAVLTRAAERGLLPPGARPSDKEVFALLFAPGFSTAKAVSSVSGRGVGMDVVKRRIEELRGKVDIESRFGRGATFHVRLPLTLAIIDGILATVGRESYILPLSAVVACQERFVTGEVRDVEVMSYMGAMIPCLSLRRVLGAPGAQPGYERVLIAQVGEEYAGLAVDAVPGRRQAVIKSLSEHFGRIGFIAGTTINGDGGISVILDVPQLLRHAWRTCRDNEDGRHDPCPSRGQTVA